MSLSSSTGITAGTERMARLLSLLGYFFSEMNASAFSVPLDTATDMVARALSLVANPTGEISDIWKGTTQIKPEFSREERQSLWVGLPHIHLAAIDALSAMMDRLQHSFTPLAQGVLQQLIYVFNAEYWSM